MIAALLEACAYCDNPANHENIVSILARPEFERARRHPAVRQSGQFNFTRGAGRSISDFCIFHRHDANEPSADKAGWVLRNLRTSGLCKDPLRSTRRWDAGSFALIFSTLLNAFRTVPNLTMKTK